MRRSGSPKARGAFSLIEVALATIIVGIGILAVVAGLGAGSRVNDAGRDLTQAVFLADEIREWTVRLPFSDPNGGTSLSSLYNANGVTYSPPQDGLGQSISGMTGWSQVLMLSWRDPNRLNTTVSPNSSTVINANVSVRFQGKEVLAANWLVAKRS